MGCSPDGKAPPCQSKLQGVAVVYNTVVYLALIKTAFKFIYLNIMNRDIMFDGIRALGNVYWLMGIRKGK